MSAPIEANVAIVGAGPAGTATAAQLGRLGVRDVVPPKGHETYLSGGSGSDAIVCLRRTLDQLILRKAQDAGVTFVPHFTANRLLTEGGRGCPSASTTSRWSSIRWSRRWSAAPPRKSSRLCKAP